MEALPRRPGVDDSEVFRAIFAASPDALLLIDQEGSVVLANPSALALLGYDGDALIGLPVDALVPDAVRPRHAAYRDAYADQPHARAMGAQTELAARRRDGSEVRVEIALSPLQGQGLPYVLAAIRDVGNYPRIKQALQRARYAEHLAQFGRLAVDARDSHALLAQVPSIAAAALPLESAVVLLLEPDGQAFRVAAGIGLRSNEQLDTLVPNDLSTRVGRMSAETRSLGPNPAGHGTELLVPLYDRGRTIGALGVRSATPTPFDDEALRFMGSLASLLSTLLQRERSEEALRHSQRLESIGQLSGGIAHDFNNLLTVISGNLQALETRPVGAGDPMAQQMVGAALRATRRGAELTNKLLAFSRRQLLQPTVIDVNTLLRSLTDMLQRMLDPHLDIAFHPGTTLCRADPVQLEAALLNLALNARDAMPDGGMLSFACRTVSKLPAGLETEASEAVTDGYVAITVSDTGTGMSEAVQERAFEPFFTTKEVGRGTGLGLSTVYGFARQSHGAIGMRSKLGVGTAFTLYLPKVRDEAAAGRPRAATGRHLPPDLRVLLVEDDAEVRRVTQRFLRALGCTVVSCADAETALRMLDIHADFGLLLTDIALGTGMRGVDLAQRVPPHLPVLLMSGFSDELQAVAPGRALLPKPYTRDELERAMLRALNPPG